MCVCVRVCVLTRLPCRSMRQTKDASTAGTLAAWQYASHGMPRKKKKTGIRKKRKTAAVRLARHAAAEGGAARQHPQLHLDQPRERRLIHSRSRMAIRSWSHSLDQPRERCAGLLASQSTHPAPTTLGSAGDCASQTSTWSPAAARSTGAPRERSVLTVT